MTRLHFLLVFFLAIIAPLTVATAQVLPSGTEQAAELAADTLGRSTPRGTVQGFIEAMAAKDEDRATLYLDVEQSSFRSLVLARELRTVLDRKGRLNATVEISQQRTGDVSDGLPADIDIVGYLGLGEESVPLKLQQVERDGAQIWLVSAETLAQVPTPYRDSAASLVERLTPDALRGAYFLGFPVADLLAALAVFALALLAGYLVAWALVWAASRIWLRRREEHADEEPSVDVGPDLAHEVGRLLARNLARIRLPLGLLLSNIWFKGGAVAAGVPVVVRELAFRLIDIGSTIAVVWLLFVLTSVVGNIVLQQMARRQRASAVSITRLLTRVVKAVVVVIGIVAILDILGFDVTTGLAALGIGGIALALGAQKTIENLVGSVMLVADQPIRVGDFCQFEGVWGVVEDIGIRSTRIRTLEHTLVTIPNGAFSSMQIDNWTQREKYLFRHTFNARYETSASEVRALMAALHTYFAEHEYVEGEEPSIRFLRLGSHSIDIEVFVYVTADDLAHWWVVQGELLLGVMETFEREGVEFAFPSQTMYLARDGKVPAVAKPGS